ncbi:peptidylprolyl isomerase [Novosphingobium sp.]|uniref:peptidylprolyl isomerase n=1 Tax=Novosphingobium sp. TaxID=1874826 RepID=UPI001ED03594|nr:peptidylprolyl isomerase [Novosphingobium sp.]MBK9011825.1 peptidyl-prolyl cis-trans isomerase [Novosphingobium sp.]
MNLAQPGRQLLREPLVHFLIAGAAVFWLLSGRAPDLGERRIVVNEQVVSGLVQRWTDTFRRPPSQDEIDGLIRDYVQDQVYYREALSLGLDQEDEVVVRRMRRKMESLAVAEAESAEPGDAVLQAMIDKDPARYSDDARTSFDQIYLGADNPANRAAADAALTRLRKGEQVAGVAAPLPSHQDEASDEAIAGTYGDEFVLALRRTPPGQWAGPVASGLGLHLVRIAARTAPTKPSLDKVRQRVTNDWRAAAIARARDESYRRILEGYDVVIVRPK